MSEIEELQSRIMAALDRVAVGVDSLDGSDSEALQQALEDMEAKAQQAVERMETLDLELQRLRRANAQLREACAALQAANAEGVGEPHLINKAMIAELEALRAMRSVERAEADQIIAALTPLLDTGAKAMGAEENV